MDEVVSVPELEQLKEFVHQALCEQDHLDPKQTPLQQWLISRSGRPCGMFFQISGPRMMRAYAIWAGEENRILFYDSSSHRYAEIQLSDAPDPAQLKELMDAEPKAG